MGSTGQAVSSAAVDAAMRRALDLAVRGPAHGPNPRVGCVLLRSASDGASDTAGDSVPDGASGTNVPDGTDVIGEGWHRGAGTPHAEVAALADARARGHDPRGATAVVTLEPCKRERNGTHGRRHLQSGPTDPGRRPL